MHTADIHFDSPFATLAGKGKFAQERRLEQRKVMKEMVEYIKENNIICKRNVKAFFTMFEEIGIC